MAEVRVTESTLIAPIVQVGPLGTGGDFTRPGTIPDGT
jgi:hypothetical protein